jgi:polyphosphate kinase 2 (PPK2 family)
MLEKIDLSKSISKEEYKSLRPELRDHLYAVQKASWDANVPVVILFEGWDAAGKGTSIQNLTARLDPRGFKLYPIRAARTYEKKRPWLWRFWLKLPGRGEWAIFDRSWYGRVLVERMEKLVPESEWRRAYRDIVDFERALADDGYLIVKFFLHISREEQRRRFEKLAKDPLNAWHVQPEDWEHHRQYDEWMLAYEEMFERTETEWGPWTIVEGTDRRHTQLKIFRTIIAALEERLSALHASPDPALWMKQEPWQAEEVQEMEEMEETVEMIAVSNPEETAVLSGEAIPPSQDNKKPLKVKKDKKAKKAKKKDKKKKKKEAAEIPVEMGEPFPEAGEFGEEVPAGETVQVTAE